ncbi:MAG: hydrogenase expression/formation protein HypD [Clostridia bacterium]|nr:hydrogenase expression/formation protein HypD [Clostridia bacterium]
MEVWAKYREAALGRGLAGKVRLQASRLAEKLGRRPVIMEVCGTHTVALSRWGIRSLLKDVLDLRSGPGCPVCVTAPEDIDAILALSEQPEIVVATFGDMVRVPGSRGSLESARLRGARVQVCYSPEEAVALAATETDKEVVLIGIGFETTAPTVALALLKARKQGIKNFSVYSAHKLVPPVLAALAEDAAIQIDGLILPGHVSVILGRRAFDFLALKYGIPAVIAGFEPVDILGALKELLETLLAGRAEVFNAYPRAVTEEGNKRAQELLREVFNTGPARWRGIGEIPESGLEVGLDYRPWNAKARWRINIEPPVIPRGCRCNNVLKGQCLPVDCGLFGRSCTPTNPIGPCMVSSEGACAAYFRYERRQI